jgi:hypothetical protein
VIVKTKESTEDEITEIFSGTEGDCIKFVKKLEEVIASKELDFKSDEDK